MTPQPLYARVSDAPKVFFVDIIETATNSTIQTIGPSSSPREAERVERGININLNHAEFHTEVRGE